MSAAKFTKDHEWLKVEADGTVTVGITHFAQDQLGDLVFVQLPEVGKTYAQGEEAAVIESVKTAGEINMPFAGEVVAVNEALADEPAKVNQDPQGEGWFFKARIADVAAVEALMDQAAYDAYIKDLH